MIRGAFTAPGTPFVPGCAGPSYQNLQHCRCLSFGSRSLIPMVYLLAQGRGSSLPASSSRPQSISDLQIHAFRGAALTPRCKGQKLSHQAASLQQSAGGAAVGEAEEASLREFEAWLAQQGTWGLSKQQSKVRLVTTPGRGRGLQAAAPVKAGDILFALPTTAFIKDHDDDEESNQLMHKDAMGSVRLAGRLLRERAKGGASPWAPYISVLPHQVPAMVESFQDVDLRALEYPPMADTYDTLRVRWVPYRAATINPACACLTPAGKVVNSRCLEADAWELMMWADSSQAVPQGTPGGQQPLRDDQQGAGYGLPVCNPASTGSSSSSSGGPSVLATGGLDAPEVLPRHPQHSWWASGYLSLLLRSSLPHLQVINSRSMEVGYASAPGIKAGALRFMAPLLDFVNHADLPEMRDHASHVFPATPPVPSPPSNIRWSLSSQPLPGMTQQPAKPSRSRARAKAAKAAKGFGSTSTEGSSSSASSQKDSSSAEAAASTAQQPPGWYLKVVATRDLQPGEELLLCYRPEESNDGFMLHYGFLPGSPPGLNPYDDIALFMGGLQQALQWHCSEYVVKGAGAPASLAELSDERALALYEEAFEAVAASLPSEQGATQVLNQSIRVRAGGRVPELLVNAFAAVIAVAEGRLKVDSSSEGEGGASSSSSSSGSGAGSKLHQCLLPSDKEHARSAIARACAQLLSGMTPLLHDLAVLAGLSAQQSSSSQQEASSQVSSTDEQLQDSITYLRLHSHYEQTLTRLAQGAVSPTPQPARDSSPDSQPHQQQGPGSSLSSHSDPGSVANSMLSFLHLAGYGVQPAKEAGVRRQSGSQGSKDVGSGPLRLAEPYALPSVPEQGPLRLALQYRVTKKMLLWDAILGCSAEQVELALQGLGTAGKQ